MIAVIADDFSGAAELAGISLRYGLKVELFVNELSNLNTGTDVVIISTDSRSLKKEEALRVTEKVLKQALALQPSLLYKKTDSVLRGYVLEEVEMQMRLMEQDRAFIMPANPSLGRTIKEGNYFVNGVEIDKTAFANDPEFPVTTADVKKILDNKVQLLNKSDELSKGIIVGEAAGTDDYTCWAEKTEGAIIAGASDFYAAILNRKYKEIQLDKPVSETPFLYVCGTAFSGRAQYIKTLKTVKWLQDEITGEWLKQAGQMLIEKQHLTIAIDKAFAPAIDLRNKMADAVVKLTSQFPVNELFIEGGSTATAILEKMNITQLVPVNELSRGVVRMKAGELFITVKPGSYPLPGEMKTVVEN